MKNKSIFRVIKMLLPALFIMGIAGCTYYRVSNKRLENRSAAKIIYNNQHTTYFVLHSGYDVWELKNVAIAEDQVSGELADMDQKALNFYQKAHNNSGGRVTKNDRAYINQVHIYVDSIAERGTRVFVKEEDIKGIEVYDLNTGVLIFSVVGTAALIGVTAFGVLLAIACNCPHVYTYDGETYYFNNTLFTGAVALNLERDDYKLMPDYFPQSETYQFIVKNEEQEQQYTNLLELIVAEHDPRIQVYPDQRGKLYSVSQPLLATSVTDDSGNDLAYLTNYDDDRAYVFNDPAATDFAHAYATFRMPEQRSDARLVLRLKNTEWGGFVYHEFSSLFGRYHDNWVKNNRKKDREEIETSMKEMGIPLVISLKQGEEWVDLDVINLVGERAYTTLIVPVDEAYLGGNEIQIRVRSGFMFWKLDYLAMDFSPADNFTATNLFPSAASGNNDANYLTQLSADDDLYMEHLVTGDSAHIEFQGIKTATGKSRTIILHSKGYYLSTAEFEGKPNREELVKFKQEGELSRFSKQLYDEYFGSLTVVFE
ncbi:MAG: hypothetical protein HYZ14_05190 [Bacteroidetes bacterium]|nr:hypothetical protein [Bacteroidota bacterium]